MTAKQKAARAKFKAIVKEAGKLRKKNPKLTQTEAVKQAWAISYGKKRTGVGAVKKKAATKVKATKRKTTEQHTDTKSHNVNIRVISGVFENVNIPVNKMYVRIWKNAYIWAGSFNSSKLSQFLKNSVGKWIEVDTKFLFNNQYNTIDGYRLYDAHIDAVKNDARKYKDFPDETVAFLDWKGIKPIIIPIDKKKIGSYQFESYPELNYYRFSNARKTINFIFWNNDYYIFNGIGYKKSKRITGTYIGDSVPVDVKNKLHNYLLTEMAKK